MHQEGESASVQETKRGTRITHLFIDTKCEGAQYFRIKGRSITYLGDGEETQLLSCIPISIKNYASIKLIKCPKEVVGFGFIDSK